MSDIKQEKSALDKVGDFKINFKNAAHYVFDNYLSKAYKHKELSDLPNHEEINAQDAKKIETLLKDGLPRERDGQQCVNRDYHGLPHTLRIAKAYVPKVIQVLANNSDDPKLKAFCRKVLDNSKLMDLVQMTMLFAVTGRESELGFRLHQQVYLKYRRDSAEYFKEYCQSQGLSTDVDVIDLFAEALYEMGNPNYKAEKGSEDEKDWKNCLHKIFSLSHNLDLWRMYNAEQHVGLWLKICNVPDDKRIQCNDELEKFAGPFLNSTGDVSHVKGHLSVWGSHGKFDLLSNDVEQCIGVIDQTQAAQIKKSETLEDKKKGEKQPNTNSFFNFKDKTAAEKVAFVSGGGAAMAVDLVVSVVCASLALKFFDSIVDNKLKPSDKIESWVIEHAEQLKLARERYWSCGDRCIFGGCSCGSCGSVCQAPV